MRTFLLIALCAMAATVSCDEISNLSPVCQNSTNELYTNVTIGTAIANNRKGGCTEISFGDCQYTEATGVWNCACVTMWDNSTSVDAIVTGAGGQSCYLNLRIEISGNQAYDNATRNVTLIASQGLSYFPLGGACNTTDKSNTWEYFARKGATDFDNSGLNMGNVTWVSATFIVSGCGAESRYTRTFSATTDAPTNEPTTVPTNEPTTIAPTTSAPTNNGTTASPATSAPTNNGTTASPATSAPTNNGTTSAPTNNGTTSAPTNTTGAPSSTPTPSSNTTNSNNGASIIASFVVLVACLIAAVTIVA